MLDFGIVPTVWGWFFLGGGGFPMIDLGLNL